MEIKDIEVRNYVLALEMSYENAMKDIAELKSVNENLLNEIKCGYNNRAKREKEHEEELKKVEESQEYWYHRCMEAETKNKELEEKRIFSSDEYDLITLTSTTPQWELRKKC